MMSKIGWKVHALHRCLLGATPFAILQTEDTMHFASDVASIVEPYVMQYGVVAVFVIIFLESLGAPLPGESVLVAASLLAVRGDVSLMALIPAAWAAAVLGDSTGYLIGHFGGRPLLQRHGWLIKLTPERLAKVEDLVRRRGALMVFGARFVVLLRQLNGLVAGITGMPWPHFVVANALGGALWVAVWTLGPYTFADSFSWSGLRQRL